MVTKIGQNSVEPPKVKTPQAPKGASSSAAKVASEGAQKTAEGGVAIVKSDAAQKLEKLSSAAGDVNTEKVQAVRESIENGTYVVDAEAIADKLLAGVFDLLGPRRSH